MQYARFFGFFLVCRFFFCLFLPSHPAQASACRSSGLFFHQIPPFCIHYHHIAQMSNKRSSGYRPTRSFPPTRRTHSAQRSYKHSSGLIFSFKPFTSASITFPISPDECLSLVWAFFSPDSPFHFPTISYSPDERLSLVWAVFSLDLSFLSHLPSHLTQTSYKRSSGCIFNTAFSLPQFHLSLNLIQLRRASSTRLGYYFHLYPSPPSSVTISISPDERQAHLIIPQNTSC